MTLALFALTAIAALLPIALLIISFHNPPHPFDRYGAIIGILMFIAIAACVYSIRLSLLNVTLREVPL